MKIENVTIGSMPGYVQCAAENRFRLDSLGWMTSAVHAGDRWQDGGDSSDDQKHSERTEFRSLVEDPVGAGSVVTYEFDLDIPVDYPELTPKQVFFQLHEGDYPIVFLRYERRVLELVTNYQSSLNFRQQISITKGCPLRLIVVVEYAPGENAGSIALITNGRLLFEKTKHSLVERGTKSVYAKVGIYRSGMDAYAGPQPAPAQTVHHRVRGRYVSSRPFSATVQSMISAPGTAIPAPVPAPVTTTPTPAVPVASSGDLYARIAGIQGELDALGKDVAREYAVSDFVGQASEKLVKLVEQMRKLDAKRGEGGVSGDEVVSLLRQACESSGSQKAWAGRHGCSAPYVNDVLLGRREPGPAILDGLGLRRVVSYEVLASDRKRKAA